MSELVVFVLNIIGTVSFAVSGALVSVKAKLDLFGVIFLGVITAVGGGILRDVLIGRIPPGIFSEFYIVFVAIVASLIVFIICYIKRDKIKYLHDKISYVNNFFDAIGLGAFTVMGTELSFSYGFSNNMFLSVVLGVTTAVGGGVMRDILADTSPYILKKHVYALVSIAGSLIYYALRWYNISATFSSAFIIAFVFVVRMVATKYCWKLPKIYYDKDEEI